MLLEVWSKDQQVSMTKRWWSATKNSGPTPDQLLFNQMLGDSQHDSRKASWGKPQRPTVSPCVPFPPKQPQMVECQALAVKILGDPVGTARVNYNYTLLAAAPSTNL